MSYWSSHSLQGAQNSLLYLITLLDIIICHTGSRKVLQLLMEIKVVIPTKWFTNLYLSMHNIHQGTTE
jgi:hypothetical protein